MVTPHSITRGRNCPECAKRSIVENRKEKTIKEFKEFINRSDSTIIMLGE